MLFEPGQLVATPAALEHLRVHGISPVELIRRHISGDWGDVCISDQRLNAKAIADGDRILSAYLTAGQKIYVITEWDRSLTTILFAAEY
jgi:hypothetical protein